jgi:hypothetical protein
MRRFRFSMGTLLLLLTIAALATVCVRQWLELKHSRAERRSVLETLLYLNQQDLARISSLLSDLAENPRGNNRSKMPQHLSQLMESRTTEIARIEAELNDQR